MGPAGNSISRDTWNKGKIVGQKAPFKLKEIWSIRVRLELFSHELRFGDRYHKRGVSVQDEIVLSTRPP